MSATKSALDKLIESTNSHWPTLTPKARAELAQLRAAAAELQAAQECSAEQARQLEEAREALHGIMDGWRDYANGHYCRTYNPGMTQGLNCAADALGAFVSGLDTLLSANAPQPQEQSA